jgi:putative ABC transport system permease protein
VSNELGPILRSIARRKSTFALVVLELASGFTIISSLLLTSAYYFEQGDKQSGYREDDLVAVSVQRAAEGATGAEARAHMHRHMQADLARLAAVPGVAAVAAVSGHMLDEVFGFPVAFQAAPGQAGGAPALPPGPGGHQFGWSLAATPSLVDVLDLKVVEGALPAAGAAAATAMATSASAPAGAVITRSLRDGLFAPGVPAVGKTVVAGDRGPARVAAVIEDVYGRMPFTYRGEFLSIRFDGGFTERESHYLARVQPGQREAVLARLPAALGPSGPAALITVKPFDSSVGMHTDFMEALFIVFAIMGLTVGLLALLGAAAVASFLVAERTRQIGIRRALGATRRAVIHYFLVENAVATLLGTGLGLVMTAALYVLMQRAFPNIRLDGSFLALTALLLWVVATLAAMIPARRAAEIPPSVASRV